MRPSYGRTVFITLSRIDPEMRRPNHTKCFGPTAYMADMARVRVRASYLLGRWVQAPISDPVREADT